MFRYSIAATAMALLMTTGAHATVLFDNITGQTQASFSGVNADGSNPIAQSFTVTGTEPITSLVLNVASTDATVGESTSVYFAADSSGTPALSGWQLAGTLTDASLSSSFTNVAITGLSQVLTDGTWWVLVDSTNNSGFEWGSNAADGGLVGVTGQRAYSGASGSQESYPIDGTGDTGGFELIVNAPEPASAALLGIGLAGLGFARRRAARKA